MGIALKCDPNFQKNALILDLRGHNSLPSNKKELIQT